MGIEIKCKAVWLSSESGGDPMDGHGKALLETEEVVFRGDFRVRMPLASLKGVVAEGDVLRLASGSGRLALHLGEKSAAAWAHKILHPKGRVEKLGIKAGARVCLLGMDVLADEVRGAGAVVVAEGPCEMLFYSVEDRAALGRLASLRKMLAPKGALWTVRPKGSPLISERDVLEAGRAVGLKDVKVVKFSETHTAEKFV